MNALRVLLVTDAVGGVWIYSADLARALKPLGIEAVLAVTGPSPTAEQRNAATDVLLIDTGLPLDWTATTERDLVRAGGRLAEIAAAEGADVVQTCSAALLAEAQLDRPCVAVQHSCLATWWAAVRGTQLPDDFAWRSALTARGLNRADAIVAPSFAFADATARAYHLAHSVCAVQNGRSQRDIRGLPQGGFVFTAGRLWDEGKNVATLDRAAAAIRAPFQAAGPLSGPNRAGIELTNLVSIGQLSDARLSGVLAARPVYASAAVYEPFGLAVLEAAQAGCALVLSDIATHRELWEGAAIFVDARHESGFAAAINDLLSDRDERNQLGQLAQARSRQFTPGRMAHGMAEIYARVTTPERQLIAGAA